MHRNDRSLPWARRHAWVACAVLALSAGCRDSAAPLPLDPALTGQWVLGGVDTYSQFTLEKRGTTVSGTFSSGVVTGPPIVYKVSGSAALPNVVLTWKDPDYHVTFDATLSADTDSLTGRMSFDGQPGSLTTYHRITYHATLQY
jgi:hypothetical protein